MLTGNLLEDMRNILGCGQAADLWLEPYNSRARDLVMAIRLERYPADEVVDVVKYLFGLGAGNGRGGKREEIERID